MLLKNKDYQRCGKALLLMNTVILPVVKETFDQQFPLNTLQSTLKTRENDVKNSKCFNKGEIEILYPGNGTVSSSRFDIAIMIKLIYNLKTTKAHTVDLNIIREIRNELDHNVGGLTTVQFDELVKKLKPAAERLAGRNLDEEFDGVINRLYFSTNRKKEILFNIIRFLLAIFYLLIYLFFAYHII